MLIDVAIPGDRNVIKKEAEKILKYKNLTIEIRSKWHAKTKVIPATTRAIGTTDILYGKYLSKVPGKYNFKELQETAILGTGHIHVGGY